MAKNRNKQNKHGMIVCWFSSTVRRSSCDGRDEEAQVDQTWPVHLCEASKRIPVLAFNFIWHFKYNEQSSANSFLLSHQIREQECIKILCKSHGVITGPSSAEGTTNGRIHYYMSLVAPFSHVISCFFSNLAVFSLVTPRAPQLFSTGSGQTSSHRPEKHVHIINYTPPSPSDSLQGTAWKRNATPGGGKRRESVARWQGGQGTGLDVEQNNTQASLD